MEVTVTEIHEYPLRPVGFVEPLFATPESRHEIAEHMLGAPWLSRASEIAGKSGSGGAAHTAEEPVHVQRHADGRVDVLRPHARRCSWRRRQVVEILMRWREVSRWWCEGEYVDRFMFRVMVARHSPGYSPGHGPMGGGVVDLALDRSGTRSGTQSGGWTLAGIVD